jgi:hypothetical protein
MKHQTLLAMLFASVAALPGYAQEQVQNSEPADPDLVSVFQRIESSLRRNGNPVDDNGLPAFRPRTGALRRKKEWIGSDPAKRDKVTLTTGQYGALLDLASQNQAAAPAAPDTAAPAVQVLDSAPTNTGAVDSGAAVAAPDSSANAASTPPPVMKVALPATASITRPPKPAAIAGAPQLRRKQQ